MKRTITILGAALAFVTIACWGCGGGASGTNTMPVIPPAPATPLGPIKGTLNLGPDQQIASFTLAAGNSSYTVKGTKTPLDGVIISAPIGGLPAAQTITLHYSLINSHTFGPLINPVSPLVSIEAPGIPANALIMITFPIAVPDDHAVIADYYNAATNTLDVIPTIGLTAATVTFNIINFGVQSRAPGSSGPGFFVTTAPVSLLESNADSGYRIGTDDCPFTNYGSAITPGGECLGTSLLNAWYFENMKSATGRPLPLYTYLDDYGNSQGPSPGFWQDDSKGYRLACVLQKQYALNEGELLNIQRNKYNQTPKDTYRNVLYGLGQQHEPLILEVWHNTGTTNLAHAVVAYFARNGHIFVSDPNVPFLPNGANEYIVYYTDSNTFSNYVSALSAQSPSQTFENILVIPRSFYLQDSQIAATWAQLNTAGTGSFPAYAVAAFNNGSPVSIDAAGNISATGTTLSLQPTGATGLSLNVFTTFTKDSQPQPIAPDANGLYNIPFQAGKPTVLGVEILQQVPDPSNAGKMIMSYLDFQYLTVTPTGNGTVSIQ